MFQKSKLLIPLIISLVAMATLAYTLAVLPETEIGKGDKTGARYYEITVNNCRYLVMDKMPTLDGIGVAIAHEGNCPNHK